MEENVKTEAIDIEKSNQQTDNRNELYSRAVKAGRRTYFFDVKSTRRGDYYLTLTESKKRFSRDGSFHFDKHKIFLYKEDFEKFVDGLQDVIEYINKNQPDFIDEEEAVFAQQEENESEKE